MVGQASLVNVGAPFGDAVIAHVGPGNAPWDNPYVIAWTTPTTGTK
ncbi:MAG: hypothetical protein JWM55_407 [Acidimicrobiaceae bacterium]|nr:hypothetical protein [Acidimicrobiaceae bacterium]